MSRNNRPSLSQEELRKRGSTADPSPRATASLPRQASKELSVASWDYAGGAVGLPRASSHILRCRSQIGSEKQIIQVCAVGCGTDVVSSAIAIVIDGLNPHRSPVAGHLAPE